MINKIIFTSQMGINLISNIISFSVSFGISFLLTPYLVETIGKEAYGFYPLANNFTSYAQLLVIALNSMASRFITIKITQNKDKEVNEYYSSVFWGNIFISIVLSILGSIFILNINKYLIIPKDLINDVILLFSLIFISLIISVLTSVFSIATFAKNRVDLRSIKEIVASIVRVVSLVTLFYFFKPSVSHIGVSNLIVTLVTFFITYYFTKKLLPNVKISLGLLNYKVIKILVSSGIWNSFNQLSAILLSGLDILISNMVLGATVSAEYGLAQTAPNFIRSLAVMIVGVFIPSLTIVYAQKNKEVFIKQIMKTIKITNIIVNIPIAYLIGFGDIFFKLWVPGEDFKKLHVISLTIVLPMLTLGTVNVLFNVCTTLNKVKVPSIVVFITGVVNIVLVVLLLNNTNLGILAIPLSSGILSLLRYLIFTPIYTANILGERWYVFYKNLFIGIVSVCISSVIAIVFKSILNINNWSLFIIISALYCLISLLINILVILNKEEKIELLEKIITIKKNEREHNE